MVLNWEVHLEALLHLGTEIVQHMMHGQRQAEQQGQQQCPENREAHLGATTLQANCKVVLKGVAQLAVALYR